MDVLNFLHEMIFSDVKIDFREVEVGWKGFKSQGSSLPEESVRSMEACDGLILGPLDVGKYPAEDPGGPSPSGHIRKHFDLFANIRPTVSYGINSSYPDGDVDLVIVRENTEGFYADRNMFMGSGEFMPTQDVAMALRVVTRKGSERIIREAFRIASSRRRHVTAVHKGNVLKISDGMFLQVFDKISKEFPNINSDNKIVDAMAFDILRSPQKYDVIVTTNMFGDILSDEAAGIAGSLGLAPSLNSGENYAMAQAVHGSAPDIAGKGISNPIAEILSCGMLLEWLGQRNRDSKLIKMSELISVATRKMIKRRENLTPDLGGNGNTESVTRGIISNIEGVHK
ncbi:Homoisocitrate dehydrogenase [Thermoplasmatales archaeon]|nr:Homoisocitrate dehydrogenase [Thermoplasmatales archaeon]